MDRDRGILGFERVEEVAVPEIDAVGDAQACEHDGNKAHRQQPCSSGIVGGPIAFRAPAEAAKRRQNGVIRGAKSKAESAHCGSSFNKARGNTRLVQVLRSRAAIKTSR